MSIHNEVVKFIAEIDLDAQDKENFLQGLKECDKECSDLRDGILHLQNSLTKLRTEGKENSKEFKDLQDALNSKTKTLKETTKQADKYSSALGASRMSMNQLKKHAKELQAAMNNMHKESNPEQWAKYEKELKIVNNRIKELKSGTDGTKKGVSSMLEDVANGFTIANGAMAAFSGAINLLKTGFKQFTTETQVWGDKWQMAVTMVQAGWSQFIANLFQGKDVIKASVNEAIQAAANAQLLLDELFERENSLKIQSVKTQTEINTLMATVKDASKSDTERLAAIEDILDLENKLAEVKRDIAQQELDAYQGTLMKRTGLDKEELKTAIDNYNANRDKFKAAENYIALLEEEKQLKKDIKLYNRSLGASPEANDVLLSQIDAARARLSEVTDAIKIAGTEEVLHFKHLLEQYNLGNDGLVENYVNAVVKVEQANADLTNQVAQLAARKGRLVNEMNAETQRANDQAYNEAKDTAEAAYRSELNLLKTHLLNREISQEEYNSRSVELERSRLEKLKELAVQYGKDVTVIDGQILDEQLKNQPPEQKNRLTTDLSVSGALTSKLPGKITTSKKDPGLAMTFEQEMTALNILHEAKAISEEEFLKRRNELYEKYGKEQQESEQGLWTQGAEEKLKATMMVLNQMGEAVSAAKDAEMASIDAQMAKELAAAGDNADKRAEIESRYEAKKLDIQKKYADTEMGIQLAQATASGAMAMIQAWNAAGGNPVLAGVIMALIGATTVAQLATIVAQRNAIKNSTPGSSSSGSSVSQQRTVNGFSEGGYTGDGGRLEVAGVVHRGEYVVPQPELRDPAVAAMVANIETRRRRRTSVNALPGFAEGGYTGLASGLGKQTDALLEQILKEIRVGNETPIPAYFVLSELYAKQELQAKMKKQTSLG